MAGRESRLFAIKAGQAEGETMRAYVVGTCDKGDELAYCGAVRDARGTIEQTPRRRLIACRTTSTIRRSPLAEEVLPRFERETLLQRFRSMAAQHEPIVGGGAGRGLSANGGGGRIDLIADVIVLCHGGPIAMAEDAAYVLRTASAATACTAPAPWSGCRRRLRSQSKRVSWRR